MLLSFRNRDRVLSILNNSQVVRFALFWFADNSFLGKPLFLCMKGIKSCLPENRADAGWQVCKLKDEENSY